MAVISPGATIGILGGGQLGRMMAIAAAQLGYKAHIYASSSCAPAAQVSARATFGGWDDEASLDAFASQVDVITLESEEVAVEALTRCGRHAPTYPSAQALRITQDRLLERAFLRAQGAPIAAYEEVRSAAQAQRAHALMGPRCVLKRARGGYDGKGQARLDATSDAGALWWQLGGAPCVMEREVRFEREASVVLGRGVSGEVASYRLVENQHEGGILRRTLAPAPGVSEEVAQRADAMARKIAEKLGFVGVMAVELFIGACGALTVNELAPRPHNSGHWTLDAAMTDQFTQHIRAVCGLDLGASDARCEAVMENLLGDEALGWQALLGDPRARLHLYDKGEVRPGRKMGHVTRLGRSLR